MLSGLFALFPAPSGARKAGAALFALTGLALAGAAAAAGPVHSDVLDRIRPGRWLIERPAPEAGTAQLCVHGGAGLVQLRHQGEQCRSVVVEDSLRKVTIQYACPGNGYGQTTIRLAGPDAARIETQGVAQGRPFAFTASARRTGDCGHP